MRRFIKIPLFIIGLPALLVLGIVASILIKPQWYVTPKNLARAAVLARLYDVRLGWRNVDVGVSSPGFLHHHLVFQFDDLCLDSQRVDTCAPRLHAELDIDIRRWPYILREIGPLSLNLNELTLKLVKAEPKREQTSAPEWNRYLNHLKKLKINPIDVRVEEWRIQKPGRDLSGSDLELNLYRPKADLWRLTLGMAKLRGAPITRFGGEIVAQMNSRKSPRWDELQLQAEANLTKGSRKIAVDGEVKNAGGNHFIFRTKGLSSKRRRILALNWDGELNKSILSSRVKVNFLRPVKSVTRIVSEECTLTGRVPLFGAKTVDLRTNCPLQLHHTFTPPGQLEIDHWPKKLTFLLTSHFRMPQGLRGHYLIDSNLELSPIINPFFTIRGHSSASLSAQGRGLPNWREMDISIDSSVNLHRFSQLVKTLDRSPWAVPAPIRRLRGDVQCAIKGRVPLDDRVSLPISCSTDLASLRQELKLATKGEFSLRKVADGYQPRLKINVHVLAAQMELPYIDARQPLPQIFPDKRVTRYQEQKSGKRLDYEITVNTGGKRPLYILSNLAEDPVPITLTNLTIAAGKPLAGYVTMEKFRLAFLKQKASLERFLIRLTGTQESPSINGLLTFQNIDYILKMQVAGTIAKPQIDIYSDPPRPQSELVSAVFLGGEDTGDEEETRSAAETQAAIADGALNLLSMYYLAATPIESVSYNPYTGVVRARFRLAQRTSLSVGSDLQTQQTIGVRRRLTGNWSVETSVQRDLETEERSERAMLRWAKRY